MQTVTELHTQRSRYFLDLFNNLEQTHTHHTQNLRTRNRQRNMQPQTQQPRGLQMRLISIAFTTQHMNTRSNTRSMFT